jgi:hypothetical protein
VLQDCYVLCAKASVDLLNIYCAMLLRCGCRAQAELEESLVDEELQRLLNDYVESRVREALASEHVQASLAERLKVGYVTWGVAGGQGRLVFLVGFLGLCCPRGRGRPAWRSVSR